ncbi:beta-N-acetylhexosaminidase [Rubritalea tangerina]|uniref:beta-N-acetylhexosaminidase n=1 Tax=Rubritalea tangerina TaxID=430798 RepID=A0ABW4Z7K9_9BACT
MHAITSRSLCLAIAATLSPLAMASPVDSVIPLPAEVTELNGALALNANTKISGPAKEAQQLLDGITALTGLKPSITRDQAAINLVLAADSSLGPEAYTLEVTTAGANITASTPTGLFYGTQTLLQMIDPTGNNAWEIPAAKINDAPRFPWRGLMLDEARHFQGKDFVLALLDNMAARKMNKFHWHLTDDEGWRIEIKAYPKLTEIGAWRGNGTPMPNVKWRAKQGSDKGPKYGGFYTQEEIKEIVAYATERHIEVIPEIDMPGHVTAITTAYPETLPTIDPTIKRKSKESGNKSRPLAELAEIPTAYRSNALSVVNEKNYEMIEQIVKEVTSLFPSKYYHLGGDEVHTTLWEHSPEHIAYMEKQGMTEFFQLQNMFMLRMEKLLKKYGRTMVGWNEIMKGGQLSKDTVVMAWLGINPGIKAAQAGHPTIMAVSPHNYFDMIYPGQGERKGNSWAGPIDSKRAYEWNPLFESQLTPEQSKLILGVHACVWSEFVPDPQDASYKFWPRACSTAEVAWSPQSKRDWSNFRDRLGKHLKYFDINGTYYRVAPPRFTLHKGRVTITPAFDNLTTKYSIDGSDPKNGKVYQGESLTAEAAKNIKAITIAGNGNPSILVDQATRDVLGKFRLHAKKLSVTTKTDVSATLDAPGSWQVILKQTKGTTPSTITKVTLLANDAPLVTQDANAPLGPNKEASVTLDVPKVEQGTTYTLQVTLERPQSKQKIKSMGEITFDTL